MALSTPRTIAQMHGFTGAIDAAIGVAEGFVAGAQIRPAGGIGIAQLDLPVAQVEPGQAASIASIGHSAANADSDHPELVHHRRYWMLAVVPRAPPAFRRGRAEVG